MTGQEVQDKLDAVVTDLQTTGKGQTTQFMFRDASNQPQILPLSSDANGVVDAVQLAAIQTFVDTLKDVVTNYNAAVAPVKAASETFKLAKANHQALYDDASTARTALNTALENDANYQAAKTAYDVERNDIEYQNARAAYAENNASENIAELTAAKGSYVG